MVMAQTISLIGNRFGRLVVIADGPRILRAKSSQPTSICLCDCGRKVQIFKSNLRRGTTNSCGCLQKELLAKRCTIHGQATRANHTRTYYKWCGMIKRCDNPNNPAWDDYGGRGIRVCERWKSFPNFLADMGEAPRGLTVGRKNNNGDYEPGNCEWQTYVVQNRNKRTNRLVVIGGVIDCVAEFSEIFNINPSTACRRMDRMGWSPEKAFSTPVR